MILFYLFHRGIVLIIKANKIFQEFTTRYAAVISLKTFLAGLCRADKLSQPADLFLDTYLILYDLLNDDDEEIRDIAAMCASMALSPSSDQASFGQVTTLLPLAASVEIARYIRQNYLVSPRLFQAVVSRFLGQNISSSSPSAEYSIIPVSAILTNVCKESNILFVEEKQNLYIDDVREVDTWATLLASLTDSAFHTTLGKMFISWVSDGLTAIIDTLREAQIDGPLGWTSKPEAFITGLRVIQGARVLLHRSGMEENEKGIISGKFRELVVDGTKAGIHERWLSISKLALP